MGAGSNAVLLLLCMCQLSGLPSELQGVCRLLEAALVNFSHPFAKAQAQMRNPPAILQACG